MNTIILTSCLDLYEKDEQGNRTAHHFGNENGILDILKANTKKFDNFLFIASDETNYTATDMYANVTFDSFNLTLPFENYYILDGRTKHNAQKLITNADFIFLCGGHLPTQNKFFNDINLKKLLQNTNALIVGGSAGSMNCAEVVYCPPELEGESLDLNFKRFLPGLGFTKTNILPHYDFFVDFNLDGKRYIEDIIVHDSYKIDIICLVDGSYIIIKDNSETIVGESYLLKNGKISVINEKK